ncbi:MAG: cell division protein CrgA [Actinobacteria bacterium]|nr:cell division protein CrgA [Actinomycetota bacterium]
MPESRHRRKGKARPRPSKAAGPPVKPKPSPPWVPTVGVSLLVLGVVVVIVTYVPNVLWDGNLGLVAGFALMAVGFGFLTQWR